MRFLSFLFFFCVLEYIVLSHAAFRPNSRNLVQQPQRPRPPASPRIATTPRRIPFVGGKPAKSGQRPRPVGSPSNKYRDLPAPWQQVAKPKKPNKPSKPLKPTTGKYRLLPPLKLKGPRKASSSDDWIPRFKFRTLTYPNPLDQTENQPDVSAQLLCVNMETEEQFPITQNQTPKVIETTSGTRISYTEAGAYSGYSYSVLHIPFATWWLYQGVCENDTVRCPNRSCRVQPGPWPIWYWRFELDPNREGGRPRVMTGVSDVTIRLRTAQAVADRLSIVNSTSSRKLSAAAKRKAMKRLKKFDTKNYRPSEIQGPRDDWTPLLAIHNPWYMNDADIVNSTEEKRYRLACIDARTGVKTMLTHHLTEWFVVHGRTNNYIIRSGPLEGLMFKTREIEQLHFWGARGTCTTRFPGTQYVQDWDETFPLNRLEIKKILGQTYRKIEPGVAHVSMPHALAQRFVNQGGPFPPNDRRRQRKKNKVN